MHDLSMNKLNRFNYLMQLLRERDMDTREFAYIICNNVSNYQLDSILEYIQLSDKYMENNKELSHDIL